MTDQDNAAQIIERLAKAAESAPELEPGSVYGYTDYQGVMHALDLTGDEWLDRPKRKKGTVTVEDVASFSQYWDKHAHNGDGERGPAEVFADLDAATITAVLNAHEADAADWQDHRLVLKLRKTEPWADWTRLDGQMMSQQLFAEFLEDHATDLAAGEGISAADLIEVAQEFHAHTKVTFKSSKRLQSGATQFQYEESVEASAGDRGTIEVPSQFVLALRPFDDAGPVGVLARFRYRLNGAGPLQLGYKLDQPERIFREAIQEVVAKAEAACATTIMLGTP